MMGSQSAKLNKRLSVGISVCLLKKTLKHFFFFVVNGSFSLSKVICSGKKVNM